MRCRKINISAKKFLFLGLAVLGFSANGPAQVAINSTGAPPDNSAMLDIRSTTKGLLIPRMEYSQMIAIANPAQGLMVYSTDDSCFYYYQSGYWAKVGVALVWNKNQNALYTNDSVGIGIATPSALLDVHGRISQTGTGRSVWIGEDAGLLNKPDSGKYNTAAGYYAMRNNTSGKYNVALGDSSLFGNRKGSGNTAIGNGTLENTASSGPADNTALGWHALNKNTSGMYNTAVGMTAMAMNVSGSSNTAFGDSTLYKNVNNNRKTAIGARALVNDTGNTYSVAVGAVALWKSTKGVFNTAIGCKALQNNTEGDYNVALGDWTLRQNSTGGGNVAVGNEALAHNTTGTLNIAIGNKAGHQVTSGSRNVFIGNMAGFYETGSNKLYIDNSDTTAPLIGGDFSNNEIYLNGKTGIHTGNPYEYLVVANPDQTGSHSARMIVSDGKGAQRRALLFVSPNHDDPDTNARIEAFNYGNGTGCDLEINRVGKGKTMFFGDVDIYGTMKVGESTAAQNSPVPGMIRWNSNTEDFEGYNGREWLSFTKETSGWSNLPNNYENISLTSWDGSSPDFFGCSVAVDSNYAVAGACLKNISGNYRQGKAYIFYNDGNGWSSQDDLVAYDGSNDDRFGCSVSISGDFALVGAKLKRVGGSNSYDGKAYLFRRNGTNWDLNGEWTYGSGSGAQFGTSVAISGNYAIVGAPGAVKARIYHYNGTTWSLQATLSPSDGGDSGFGQSVAICDNYAICGCYNKDVGSNTEQGAAYIYHRNGTTWSQQAIITASDGYTNYHFGKSVAISDDWVLVGEYNRVCIFRRSGASWYEQNPIEGSDTKYGSDFGTSVSISGDLAVVGAELQNVGGYGINGKSYVFKRSGNVWSEQARIIASDEAYHDYFGCSVAISGQTILVGAYGKTVNNNENQGKIYFFEYKP